MTGMPVGTRRLAAGTLGIVLSAFVVVALSAIAFGWQATFLALFLLAAFAYAKSVYERVKADEAESVDYDEAAFQQRKQTLRDEVIRYDARRPNRQKGA